MKKFKPIRLILLSTLFLFTMTSCQSNHTRDAKNIQSSFNTYLDHIFSNMIANDSLTLNYTISDPSNYNIKPDEISLGDFSIESMKNGLASEENYLNTLNHFDYSSLTKDQQLTYDILKDHLITDQQYGNFLLYTEVLGPTTGIQAQLPILLAEYNFYTKQDIDNYLLLLKDVKNYFDNICEFERQKSNAKLFMSDFVADAIIKQCVSFISDADHNYLVEYFNDKINLFKGLTDSEKETYKKDNEEAIKDYVIPAYENLVFTLNQLKGTGVNNQGLCYYENGQKYYEYLIKSTTGSSRSVEEIATMLDSTLNSTLMDMAVLIHTDKDALSKLKEYHYIQTKPDQSIDYLKNAIKKDFPSLPPVDCNIKYVHKSLQDYVSPAMYLVPPIDNYKENCIYINSNPAYDMSELFITLAHEGYPGHLYQCVYFRSKEPHPIRSILGYVGYDEGWATYAENYSYSIAGLDETVAELLKDNMIATHCIYSRTDIGIHYEGWSYEQVSKYLSQFVSPKSVDIIYQTLLEEPAIYLPYSVGYLELMELKNRAESYLGDDFNLKEFHKFILDLGPCNFDIINNRMDEWLH